MSLLDVPPPVPFPRRLVTFWLVGWIASSPAAHGLHGAVQMAVNWPLVGFQLSEIMGFARLLAISSTLFVAVVLGELYRQAVVAVGVVCLFAALLSNIDRSTGLVGRYVLFGISVFAVGFGLYRGLVRGFGKFRRDGGCQGDLDCTP